MSYIQPKCCGKALQVVAVVSLVTAVKSDGSLNMRSPYINAFELSELWCMDCKATYAASKDDKGRIVKCERK